jgi:tetratricopeptide (TPR) repeat protein
MRFRNSLLGFVFAVASIAAVLPGLASAEAVDGELLALQRDWDVVNYETPVGDARIKRFEALLERVRELAARNPTRVEAQIWEGIVLSSLAGAKGGLGALSVAKQARDRLTPALAAGPDVLGGSAYTTLGVLYYKVPGFPLGFGNKKRAEELLKGALARNPDGLDPNFFYGEFLAEQGKTADAMALLRHALQAPARPERPVADRGRRAEVQALLTKLAAGKG